MFYNEEGIVNFFVLCIDEAYEVDREENRTLNHMKHATITEVDEEHCCEESPVMELAKDYHNNNNDNVNLGITDTNTVMMDDEVAAFLNAQFDAARVMDSPTPEASPCSSTFSEPSSPISVDGLDVSWLLKELS